MDSGDTTIRYQTKYGKPAAFADGDFDDLSELLTGEHLNYVRFQLPDSARALSTTTTMTGNTPARCPPAGITTAPAKRLFGPGLLRSGRKFLWHGENRLYRMEHKGGAL